MLELLQSNRMSFLVETLAERLQQPNDPFQPALVVVQSQGIGQWLKVELAERLGIAANIDCLLPAELIWRLYQQVLPDHLGIELPAESPFSRALLSWRLMQQLPAMTEPGICNYLGGAGDPQLRQYQLSHEIALLFDQYLIYRPDWIYQWEAGQAHPELPWQSELWQAVTKEPGMDTRLHRANLHKAFLKALSDSNMAARLPDQLNVLGISSLPKMHLETLQAVAEHTQVAIYFMNPCQHYWGDIESEKTVAKRSIRDIIGKQGPLVEEDYLEVGNPLLSSTGQQGREFLELLLETDGIQTADLFQSEPPDNALTQVQNDILNLELAGEFFDLDASPPTLSQSGEDHSVQIHSTHSRVREIEVLLDQLLAIIDDAGGDIKPTDIIVMAPDITNYAPFVQSVFQQKLPFSITDRPVVDESALLLAFEKLLALPESRLSATDVMDLLDVPAIARKFALNEADIAVIHYWIRESGVRFEQDGKAKSANWGLPEDDYNTWRFGLDRLLLGYAMEPAAGLYENIAPFELSPADAQLLGTLCDILDLLVHHRTALSQSHSAAEWQAQINRLLEDLIEPTMEEEFVLDHIADALETLVLQTETAQFSETISPHLFRYWLKQALDQPAQNRGFVSGGVTFATLVPMRSIPYRCVCLIGMNDREFPREDKPLSFDLMSKQYRKGDRSRRNDDRYLFLEAILSAQEYLYLSFIGRGQRDNKPKPPSELLSELHDYLQRLYGTFAITEHPLQPYDVRYFAVDSKLKSYATQWRGALQAAEPVPPFAGAALQPAVDTETLQDLNDLTRFFRHPARYFLNRLGVYFPEDDAGLKDAESFSLDGLERYDIATGALDTLLSPSFQPPMIDAWIAQTRASGKMLPGQLGYQQLAEQLTLAQRIATVVNELSDGTTEIQQFDIVLGNHSLACELTLRNNRLIAARTGELRARQIIETWIQHLALCAHGLERPSTMVYRDTHHNVKQHTIKPVTRNQAQDWLEHLSQLFIQGLSQPLLFMPEASLLAAREQDLGKVIRGYQSDQDGDKRGQEAHDPYYNRVLEFPEAFSEDFLTLANQIWQPYLAQEEK
jgi:exodeoxyribonuclease V gamma subunit